MRWRSMFRCLWPKLTWCESASFRRIFRTLKREYAAINSMSTWWLVLDSTQIGLILKTKAAHFTPPRHRRRLSGRFDLVELRYPVIRTGHIMSWMTILPHFAFLTGVLWLSINQSKECSMCLSSLTIRIFRQFGDLTSLFFYRLPRRRHRTCRRK